MDGNLSCLSSSGHRVECILPDAQQIPSSASKRFPSLGKLHEQTNDTTPEPESSSESAPGCRLEIQARSLGDARPRRRTQPTISLRSQFAPCQPLSRKTKSHGRAPNRRRIWATHLPSPTPSLPLGRHRMHVHCTTGPVRPGRKPSPAVPVPRHGRKRGPLRCVDQVPRAG